jgi:TldD protein
MRELLEALRDTAKKRGAEFMDVRAMENQGTSIQLQDGRADKVSQSRSRGLGVRVLMNRAWGFASTDGYDRQRAFDCLELAMAMAKASQARLGELGALAEAPAAQDSVPPRFEKDPHSVPLADKMKLLSQYEQAAVAAGQGKLVNTVVSYSDGRERASLCNTRGTYLETESIRTMVGASMTALDGDVRQQAGERRGEQCGYELIDRLTPDEVSAKAAKRAVALLKAKRAPAGKFTVVFHPSITGLLTHEALGHNSEADLVLSGQSILEGKLGQKIASECITIIDDGTIPGSWGSYAYDSEGTASQRRVIIENGVLKGFLHSLETAAKMGVAPNGSARAQGFGNRPVVRMSNTFIVPGTMTFEELLKDIDIGVYLKGGQWGYVLCERGQYTCSAGEGYMIRNGQLAEHLRDVCISGLTLETLANADAVSRDFEMQMPGMCGKSGQGMHINAGGPHVRVRDIVVGGQE